MNGLQKFELRPINRNRRLSLPQTAAETFILTAQDRKFLSALRSTAPIKVHHIPVFEPMNSDARRREMQLKQELDVEAMIEDTTHRVATAKKLLRLQHYMTGIAACLIAAAFLNLL